MFSFCYQSRFHPKMAEAMVLQKNVLLSFASWFVSILFAQSPGCRYDGNENPQTPAKRFSNEAKANRLPYTFKQFHLFI